MSDNLVPLSDIERMAKYAVDSKLFGVKDQASAVALMLLCQAEGQHPMRACQQFHIVQGRPTMKSEAMLARFQAAGGTVQWTESSATRAAATFSHPQGGTLKVEWTLERAKKIGLTNKDNWVNYPSAMLRARVVSEGVRAILPGCTLGILSEEEARELPPERPPLPVTRGVAGLEAAVKELTAAEEPPAAEEPSPVYAGDEPCSKEEATAFLAKAKAAGISGTEAVFAFVESTLGHAIKKLGDLSRAEVMELSLRLPEQPEERSW